MIVMHPTGFHEGLKYYGVKKKDLRLDGPSRTQSLAFLSRTGVALSTS